MALIRAQVRIPYFTGLPEDIVTNTFHFITAGIPATQAELDDIANRIRSFYGEFDQYLASVLSRTVDACQIRMYDLADPEPRTPVDTQTFSLAAALTVGNLPLECAVVLSYHAAFISGVPNARRRGRAYLGPFYPNANVPGTATAFPTVLNTVVSAVVDGAVLLGTDLTEVVTWAQYSPTTGVASPVERGWVDNEFDTQRRRQARATARTTFSTPV